MEEADSFSVYNTMTKASKIQALKSINGATFINYTNFVCSPGTSNKASHFPIGQTSKHDGWPFTCEVLWGGADFWSQINHWHIRDDLCYPFRRRLWIECMVLLHRSQANLGSHVGKYLAVHPSFYTDIQNTGKRTLSWHSHPGTSHFSDYPGTWILSVTNTFQS